MPLPLQGQAPAASRGLLRVATVNVGVIDLKACIGLNIGKFRIMLAKKAAAANAKPPPPPIGMPQGWWDKILRQRAIKRAQIVQELLKAQADLKVLKDRKAKNDLKVLKDRRAQIVQELQKAQRTSSH